MTTDTLAHLEAVVSPRGNAARLAVRDGTSDLSIVFGTFSNHWAIGDDEYRLRELTFSGWVVDVGAHIGTVGIAILLDNPDARVLFVEPVAENVALLRQSLAENGLEGRSQVIEAAIGSGRVQLGQGQDDRWVANLAGHDGESRQARVINMAAIRKAIGQPAALKLDCEGCEWRLLRDARTVPLIFGEYHGDPGPDGLRSMLPRHDIAIRQSGATGWFQAVRR